MRAIFQGHHACGVDIEGFALVHQLVKHFDGIIPGTQDS